MIIVLDFIAKLHYISHFKLSFLIILTSAVYDSKTLILGGKGGDVERFCCFIRNANKCIAYNVFVRKEDKSCPKKTFFNTVQEVILKKREDNEAII